MPKKISVTVRPKSKGTGKIKVKVKPKKKTIPAHSKETLRRIKNGSSMIAKGKKKKSSKC